MGITEITEKIVAGARVQTIRMGWSDAELPCDLAAARALRQHGAELAARLPRVQASTREARDLFLPYAVRDCAAQIAFRRRLLKI